MKEKLESRIWSTKKARMRREYRFLGLERRNELLNIYYTLILVLCSLWSLYENVAQGNFSSRDILLVLLSIVAMTFSIYTSKSRYVERANWMRECYTELAKIEFKLKSTSIQEEEIVKLNDEYQNILNRYENHRDIDFLEVKNRKWNYWRLWTLEKIIDIFFWIVPALIISFVMVKL